MTLIEILLSLFLPPLAVFLKKGLGRQFWITVVLTLLGHVPGVVYALMVSTEKT
jgi:uncharacterized membrane protein YqaE (UPF0057 family)